MTIADLNALCIQLNNIEDNLRSLWFSMSEAMLFSCTGICFVVCIQFVYHYRLTSWWSDVILRLNVMRSSALFILNEHESNYVYFYFSQVEML